MSRQSVQLVGTTEDGRGWGGRRFTATGTRLPRWSMPVNTLVSLRDELVLSGRNRRANCEYSLRDGSAEMKKDRTTNTMITTVSGISNHLPSNCKLLEMPHRSRHVRLFDVVFRIRSMPNRAARLVLAERNSISISEAVCTIQSLGGCRVITGLHPTRGPWTHAWKLEHRRAVRRKCEGYIEWVYLVQRLIVPIVFEWVPKWWVWHVVG